MIAIFSSSITRLQNDALDYRKGMRVVQQVLRYLRLAHSCNILHRDVRPSNIIVCAPLDGVSDLHVRLADWGLAAETSGGEFRDTMLVGVPLYVSDSLLRQHGHFVVRYTFWDDLEALAHTYARLLFGMATCC
jgi:serine/threonine protein kinase